jgi:hypothetical protein
MTFVDHNIISSAAQLIMDGIEQTAQPFADDQSEWQGFDEDEAKALKAVLDEVNWSDLCEAVRLAAQRVNARPDAEVDEYEDESGDEPYDDEPAEVDA